VIFNVAQLLKAPKGSTRTYPVDEPFEADLEPEASAVGPIQGSIGLFRTVDGILLTGSLILPVELSCCRCLKPFTTQVSIAPEEEFQPTVDLASGDLLHEFSGEPDLRIDEHHLLHATELLRQLITVSVPMHPVCGSGCLGLCPRCGKDLNEGACSCDSDELDPRLVTLKKLLAED
jgi:uncharacterized protein